MSTIELIRAMKAQRDAARQYRDDAKRLLDLERAERDRDHPLLARRARYMAHIAIRAAQAEEVNP